jgi:hypothetical protein
MKTINAKWEISNYQLPFGRFDDLEKSLSP